MRRIKQFASVRNELLIRFSIITLLVSFSTGLLSQAAFAQNTYVITDGDRVVVHTTYATDPDTVLDEAGLELGKDDTYITQEGNGNTEIIISRIQMVTVDDGSQTLKIGTYGETVGALLSRLGISLDENTRVTQPLSATTCDGMTIEVIHRETRTIEYIENVDYETTYCYDASLAEGETSVLAEGAAGQIACTARVTYENGEEISREVINEELVTPAIDRVVACSIDRETKVQEGNGRPYTENNPAPANTTASSPQPEAAAEVQTDSASPTEVQESPDNTVVTASGEVLTYSKAFSMTATAYSCEGYTGITATGTTARVGAVAVDPSVIPLGSRLYIVTDDGAYVYGVCTAEDTGGYIIGNRVDLYFDTVAECYVFGVRSCTVYVLD